MRGLLYTASRDKVDVDTFHKDIQYALEKLGKSNFGFERTAVLYQILKAKDTRALGTSLLIIPELRVLVLTKRHVGSGNKIGNSYIHPHMRSSWCLFKLSKNREMYLRTLVRYMKSSTFEPGLTNWLKGQGHAILVNFSTDQMVIELTKI